MTNMAKQRANPDHLVAQIARREHGTVDFDQLRAAGIGPSSIALRVRTGRLHRKHRGVYAVGHPKLSHEGVWLAAVKACGREAALSHQSAAQLAKMLSLAAYNGPVHVTIPGTGGRRRRNGIIVHRSTTLTRKDVMRRDGIPTTNPARTLADLRPVLPREQWEDALDQARHLGPPFGDLRIKDPARSRLERAFRRICRRHRLPLPEMNVGIGPYRVDFLWREQHLVVETDGWETLRDRASFEADRARDAELKLRGYDVIRFTFRQVLEDPERVARTLRALLARRQATPSPASQRTRAPARRRADQPAC
jgi:very-short-patch-repair endonuclease